jgi:hypothetical protein
MISTENNIAKDNRKFSISLIKGNPRKSIFKHDSKYEFDAPKFYDFTNTEINNSLPI